MGLIKKISEIRELRKEEKELKREERLILREMAQERLDKRRALEKKQKMFETMLDMRLPCENIIRLECSNPDWYKSIYFLMDITPFCAILFLQQGIAPTIKFKQLTGNDAGRVYEESKYATLLYGALNAMDKGYSIGLFNLSKNNRGKLSVTINGYKNDQIDQHFGEDTELEKIYGKTITIRQLLLLWKKDNKLEPVIDINKDYEIVKQLYDSEDILKEDKEKTNSK